MKNILPILVVVILVLSGLGAVAISNNEKTICNFYEDELDQYQTEVTENTTIPFGQIFVNETIIFNVQIAQSFIPSKDIITRVEILIGKNVTATYPIIVSIRKELTDEDLASVSIDPDDVPPVEEINWVFADFDDIHITTGETYYLVALTENITDNYYGWQGNNQSESYPFGCFWYSIDDGGSWSNKSSSSNQNNMAEYVYQHNKPRFDENITWDLCFKTYGRDNLAPDAPSIEGQTKGNTGTSYDYILNAIDPEGDDVKYIIDWGDGNSDETDFSASGEDVTLSHSWSAKGTYIIKVKAEDIFGLESTETELEVSMPRVRSINNLFLRLLNQLPNRFIILRYLLSF